MTMDYSSDESFVWEKASRGSDDSFEVKHKVNGDESEIRIEHEKKYADENNHTKEPKVKKRKHQVEENSLDEVETHKKKKIKTEPESDSDTKKKKKKKSNISSFNGDFNNWDQQDNDEYLNMRVKQEQDHEPARNVKLKKNETQQDSHFHNTNSECEKEYNDNTPKKEKKSKKKKKHASDLVSADSPSENDLSNNIDCNPTEEILEPYRKRSKKKKNRESQRADSTVIEDICLEETNVQECPKHLANDENQPLHNDQDSNLEHNIDEHAELKNHKSSKRDRRNSQALLQNGSPKKKMPIESTAQSTPYNVGVQSKTHPARLLDRIRFEEDPDSDIDISKRNNDSSTYLQKYLKQNDHLQTISKLLQNDSEITNDDEIWIFKFPHDIDIQKLCNTDFHLDSKSKIKINGETYCGNLDEDESKITVMTSDRNNYFIKNIVANGTIHFRKRLPKLHVPEDNVMVNNQTDFIPLPETKCRHPLFGPNYKDAIRVHAHRVPADHADADLEESITSEKKKKKKHKKERPIRPKLEMDVDVPLDKSLKIENESDFTVKKAKKRKHSDNNESFKKKSKKIKIEPDSAEAWESEKAIEQNLFNF